MTSVHAETSPGRPLLLTVQEALDLMRLSRPSLYALIKSGRIKTVRFGRARRVPLAEVERLSKASFVPLNDLPARRRKEIAA